MIYSGTSGLLLPFPKRDFPPEHADKSRLAYYATLFNSLEVNSSFYKIPLTKTVARWADEVPKHFRFTFKLWKGITHNKHLKFNPVDVVKFISVIEPATTRKGCLLVQFPPGLAVNAINQLAKLLDILGREWPVAVEFRNKSWYTEEVYQLLELHGAALVIHDMPASATPLVTTANFVYLRFHGPGGRYRGSYNDQFLSEYATYIEEWRAEGKEVYFYFNNTAGDALNNLYTLNANLKIK